jgi:hypothetical protein
MSSVSLYNLSDFQVHQGVDQESFLPRPLGWEKAYQIAIVIFYYLFFPITYPIKLLIEFVHPFNMVSDAVGRATIFASDLYNPKFGVLGELLLKSKGCQTKLDLNRLNKTRELFKLVGAEFVDLESQDGQKFEMMRITQENFRASVEGKGGKFVWHDDREIIEGGDVELKKALRKLGWPQVEEGFQFRRGHEVIKGREDGGVEDGKSQGAVMRMHPYSHLFLFEKKYIINHLALGKDVVTYDPRGYRQGDKLSSEVGVYLDAEAAYKQVKEVWGYAPKDIWITTKCGSTPVSLFIRQRFGDDFNMVIENSYLNYPDTMKQNIPLLHMIGLSVTGHLSSKDKKTIEIASAQNGISQYCDSFNNVSKLKSIAERSQDWQSTIVVISAERDLSVEPGAGSELARLSSKVSKATYHLVHKLPGEQTDGHYDEALLTDSEVFEPYSQILTGGRQVVHLNCPVGKD